MTSTPPVRTPSPSQEEEELAETILHRYNALTTGCLSSTAAVDLMKRSGLPNIVLRDIWTIVDENKSGELERGELERALRLMAWVQLGEKVERTLVERVGPLPKLDGINTDVPGPSSSPGAAGVPGPSPSPAAAAAPSNPNTSSAPSSRPGTSAGTRRPPVPPLPAIQLPPVNPEDTSRFRQAFLNAEPLKGHLNADHALEIYMSFNLPFSTIHAVRKLVDRTDQGILDFSEFALGMYLLQALQSCQIPALPHTIPQSLFEQFSLDAENSKPPSVSPPVPPRPPTRPSGQRPHSMHGSRASFSNLQSAQPPLPPQPLQRRPESPFTNNVITTEPETTQTQTQTPINVVPSQPPLHEEPQPQSTNSGSTWDWDVQSHEKLEYDRQFLKLDLERKGYIDGELFAKFMVGAHSEDIPHYELAQIWELADIHSDGKIDHEEFAVAMHLIKQRAAGEALPNTLPPTLIPPAHKRLPQPPATPLQRSGSRSASIPHTQTPSSSSRSSPPPIPQRSPTLKAKSKPPPPPPKPLEHRRPSLIARTRPGVVSAIQSLSSGHSVRYSISLPTSPESQGQSEYASNSSSNSTPISTLNHRDSRATFDNQNPPPPLRPPPPVPSPREEVSSPFEDPDNAVGPLSPHIQQHTHMHMPTSPTPNHTHHYQHHSRTDTLNTSSPNNVSTPSSPLPLPPPNNNNHNTEAIEEFKRETGRLALQVESLLSQLTAQNTLRDLNDNLKSENDRLVRQVKEMERTVSEVLSMNERNPALMEQIDRLTAELANKDAQVENSERMLAVLSQEDEELRKQLKDAQVALVKVRNESEDVKEMSVNHVAEIEELKTRLADMGKAMAQDDQNNPQSVNLRQMRVLFRDVTRENEKLKGQVREMEKSMEQLLLNSRGHAKQDELERENRRLTKHVQELEIFATQLNSNPKRANGAAEGPGRGKGGGGGGEAPEALVKENDFLKNKLREGQRAYGEYRSTTDTKLEDMRRQLSALQEENTKLKVDMHHAASGSGDDRSVPPPAYEAFVLRD